jgi:ferredoxin
MMMSAKGQNINMAVSINTDLCVGCDGCMDECPLELLSLLDGKVFQAEPDDCVECGRCLGVCESGALSL